MPPLWVLKTSKVGASGLLSTAVTTLLHGFWWTVRFSCRLQTQAWGKVRSRPWPNAAIVTILKRRRLLHEGFC